jgi:PAS domain S-box-containing protein
MSVLVRLFVLILLAVVPGLALQLYELNALREARRAQAVEEVRRDAYALADELQQILDGAQNILIAIASAPEVREQDWERCGRFLVALGGASEAYTGFAVADPDGIMRCSSNPASVGIPVARRDYFREAIATGQPSLGTYTIGQPHGLPILPISRPVFDKDGDIVAVAIGAIRVEWLIDHYKQRPKPAGALTFVADRNGTVLVRLPDDGTRTGRPANEVARAAMEQNRPAIIETDAGDGVPRIIAYEPANTSPSMGLHIAAGLPTDYLFAPVERASRRGLVVALAGALLAAAALLLGGATMITRPLRHLGFATAAIRKGDYDAALALRPGRDEFGQLAEAFKAMGMAIAEREKRLRVGEAKYRELMESLDDGVFVAQDSRFVFANPALPAMLGYTASEFAGLPFAAVVASDDLPVWSARFAQRLVGDTAPLERYEVRLRHKGGTILWTDLHARPIDYEGRPAVLGIVRDITARRRSEERLKLLAAEVDHRAKNMLAVVQAMVRLTRAETIPAFRAAVEGRIATLARAHTLLSQSRWEGADLRRLVEEELAPHRRGDGTRIGIDGPTVALTPAAAQSMAMALHELVTNAAKYGALSVQSGHVDVAWRMPDGTLELRWIETGGPPLRPPQRRGIGTGVIERSVRDQLGGAVMFDWRDKGLVCEIRVPRAHLTGRAAAE